MMAVKHNKVLFKFSLLVSLSFFISSNIAFAQTTTLLKKIHECRNISIDTERLRCFDKLSEEESIAKYQEHAFAEEQIKQQRSSTANKPIELSSVNLTIKSLKKTAHGKWLITTTNGQVWQQKGSERILLKAGQPIVISKKALGATYLSKPESNLSTQVKRLR